MKMQPVHRTLLEVNEEFLISETPAAPFLRALLNKHVLTDLDLQQLSSLEPQGARAVKRFVLHVLPLRGPIAYPALLEALQESQAQHLVDLLLEGEAVLNAAVKPITLPEAPEKPPEEVPEDPNEYARKLTANRDLIEEAVSPEHLIAPLRQSGVLTALEEGLLDTVQGRRTLVWSILWGVLLQRGLKAYRAFMGALLQGGYSALFHTIEETKVSGEEAMKSALSRNTGSAGHQNPSTDRPSSKAGTLHGTNPRVPEPRHNHNSPVPALSGKSLALSGYAPYPYRDSPLPLHSSRGPVVPPLWAGSLSSEGSARSNKVFSSSPRHPHASPAKPDYSLGDLDFLYTPKTELQMKNREAPVTRSVDLLYNPSWTDRYNHLRGADVGSPRPLYSSSLYGTQETEPRRLHLNPDYPPNPTSTNPFEQNHDIRTKENEPLAVSVSTDDPKDSIPFTQLEAISEKDEGSSRAATVPTLSADSTHDQIMDKTDDSNLKNTLQPSESQIDHKLQQADSSSAEAQEENSGQISSEKHPVRDQKSLLQKDKPGITSSEEQDVSQTDASLDKTATKEVIQKIMSLSS